MTTSTPASDSSPASISPVGPTCDQYGVLGQASQPFLGQDRSPELVDVRRASSPAIPLHAGAPSAAEAPPYRRRLTATTEVAPETDGQDGDAYG